MRRQLLLALALGVAALSPARADMISFNGAQVGNTPSDFDVRRTGRGGPAQWVVVRDASAQGGLALEQVSRDKADYRFPLAIYKPFSGANVEVKARFKPVSGAVDRAGGIAVRLATSDDYYVVRANALEDNVRFYRVVKGRREQLESASLKVSANEWHTLALKAEGDRFTISFDGKPLYTVTDKTFAKEGKVALWTKSDSVTRFDSIDIKPLP
jgi:glycosyl hydrolase family 59 (putative galactocerebrosidase)